ncbi:MAG: M48 family metallopeptidase [Candidatus Obscuribacterales bacterium]|nr:M48 family metallopeptidase [Candidatus Obscuribacterales bacterium]
MAQSERSGSSIAIQIAIALIIAAFSLFSYFGKSVYNPVTEQKQHVDMTPKQEIALGLESAPRMASEYGGEANDLQGQAAVKLVGDDLVNKTDASKTPYKYDFHLLADDHTVNAFALPGGQVFITEGLYKHLTTKGELACVLGHEVGHVVARHSAQQIAKQELTQGLTGAAVVATYDPHENNQNHAAMAMLVGKVISLKFGRNDELEADKLGVRFSSEAGYDPRSMIKVMEILDKLAKTRTPEFFSTHPNPENRIKRITAEIAERYPNGVPDGLIQ